MRSMWLMLIGFCLTAAVAPSRASTLTTERFTCPIGKQQFNATVYGSLTIYATGLDGRPIGTMKGYVPYPECPTNKLIMYRDFSPDELRLLELLVKSPEYGQLVNTESSFYRVAWLENALNPKSSDYAWHLLQATWYVEGSEERKNRYRSAFIAAAEVQQPDPSDMRSMLLRLRLINAWRELGQFRKVLDELALLPVDGLSEGLPNTEDDSDGLSESDKARWTFVRDASRLKRLALRSDRSINPIDYLPGWLADEACLFLEPKTKFEVEFCAQPEIVDRTGESKAYYKAHPAEFIDQQNAFRFDGPIQATPPPPK